MRVLLALAVVGTIVVSLLPPDEIPGPLSGSDWLMHGLGYALLGFLAVASGLRWPMAWGCALALGVLIEIAQGAVGYRSFEVRDIVADGVGAGVGVLVATRTLAPVWRHQADVAQQAKREGRRDRVAQREQRRLDRAMKPAKVAAKRGAPTWQQVAQRQGTKCWLCGTRTYADDRQRDASGREQLGRTFPCVDYVIAIEAGGTHEDHNVRLAHRHCAAARRANPALTKFGRPPRTYS
jgi:hypothetical protein